MKQLINLVEINQIGIDGKYILPFLLWILFASLFLATQAFTSVLPETFSPINNYSV
jgi:hypothetical protein